MPLYEYYCSDCQTKFTALRSMREADATIACERCEGRRPVRVLSTFAVHSKGRTQPASAGGGGCGCGGACACGHGQN